MSGVTVTLKFESSTSDALESWQQSVRDNAINIIQKTLPQKILSLNAKIAEVDRKKDHIFSKAAYFDPTPVGIDTTVYPSSSSSSADLAPSAKKRKVTDAAKINGDVAHEDALVFPGIVHTPSYIATALDQLRIEWDQLIELMDSLKMYINLQMPQIEDGDTFGVSIQEEALNEIVRTQDSAYNLIATPFTYHSTRGDLAAKLVRYPGVADYAEAIKEHDRKMVYRLKMHLTDMRNMYAVVFDIVKKNIAKISKPKSGNQMGSYG
ncbi:related to Proteasome activator complex subunit 3 [Melanopsichium pennsylvanicum]|uniref:Related to Proteasome activator complex subunit 3 n=2 Tax=Melanopsichium pennsylvanicum TaxID=63383 RepID=A0AAJ4XKS5_9BASI|nr:related to Proteasome activator complex subunit 3 [Melanopsichium pennsylvanicum 4]SNX84112.1 related to Proteasome activator complex subunit 3 [Melanopsichium pennsylvanicum]